MEAKKLLYVQANMLAGIEADSFFCETVVDVEAEALVIAMHHSLEEVEAETHKETLRDVETEVSA